ncbi:uncharacterized protein LOC141708940 [Apium graveolens]|uniref:uncharacterized protein LOC141708940 n=1 Tax=Apium graveolens TaxID=4045 RepID=UPI003D7AB918
MQALKRVKEISNLARGSKAWCRARSSYAASVPCDAPKVKRTGKRMPIGERRVMVESFVNRYRGDNLGKFPTVSRAMQEVGGSYYVVKKIMQELEYNSKLPSSNARKEVSSETEVRDSHSSSGLKSNAEKAQKEEFNQCIRQPLVDVSCAKKSEDAEEETHFESVSNVDSSESQNEELQPSNENSIPNIPDNSKEETTCESVPDVDSSESQNEEHQPSHENSIPNVPENSKEEHQNSARELSKEQTVEKIQTKSSIWGTLKSAFINIWKKE